MSQPCSVVHIHTDIIKHNSLLSSRLTHLSGGVLVVDVPPPRVEVLVVDVELVVAGASGFVPRVHDDARLHQRRHRLLKGRQVLLLELVRQVALYFAVKGRSKKVGQRLREFPLWQK